MAAFPSYLLRLASTGRAHVVVLPASAGVYPRLGHRAATNMLHALADLAAYEHASTAVLARSWPGDAAAASASIGLRKQLDDLAAFHRGQWPPAATT